MSRLEDIEKDQRQLDRRYAAIIKSATRDERRDVRHHVSDSLWQRPLGIVCPHGLEVVAVNGTHVRNNYDSDFVQGGNGFRYKFCPQPHLWIEEAMPRAEWPFVLFHECVETELMRQGMSYDRAHNIAKRRENNYRRSGSVPYWSALLKGKK